MPSPAIQQILRQALASHTSKKLGQAEQLYLRALSEDPDDPNALHLLGVLRGERGLLGDAAQLLDRAIGIKPDVSRYHSDYGNLLCEQGRTSDAIACYRRAIELDPQVALYQVNLGAALRDIGDPVEAIAAYQRALALDPRSAPARNNLGVVLADEGRLDEAVASFERAIEIDPGYADAHTNLGVTLYANRRGDDAIVHCRKAAERNPAFAKGHSNLALILLGTGSYREGWVEHEWRWKCNPAFKPRELAQPIWDGAPLTGKTILLHAEQGLGDTIQFARYAPSVAELGGQVILECQPALARFFQSLSGPVGVVSSGQPLPAFDTHCSLMSLPYALREDTIRADVPYLHASPRLVRVWEQKLGLSNQKRFGLVWAGRPSHSNDRNRSMPAQNLSLLADLTGIEWHSLQKDSTAGLDHGLRIIDHSADLNDFADTAALVANLDLVISVDTAVAHLAGAMGKPTWVLLPFASEWRWMLNRDDSPWYPTVRLCRQEKWGDWAGVMRRVAAALQSEP